MNDILLIYLNNIHCEFSLIRNSSKNNADIKLTMIGTGTVRSIDSRACSAYIIESPDSTLLIDCGPGSWLRLNDFKKDIIKIDHIFLTHFHPDHIIDLIMILFTRYHMPSQQPRSVHIWGATGLRQFFNLMVEAFGDWLQDPMFKVIELQASIYNISNLTLTWLPVKHAPESIGYRFETNQKVISIPGDSGYCQEIMNLSQDADIAILECSFPDDKAEDYHLTPSQVGEIARQASIQKLILSHLYPEVLQTDIKHEVSQKYTGPCYIAQDGDVFVL